MEAVPRMPMLSIELKNVSESVEFTPVLKNYIEDFYSENPENYNQECRELDQLRQSVNNLPQDFTGCSTLKKYYAQLQFLKSRFPMEEGGMLAIPFTWDEVYSGKSVAIADIGYEEACVLHNVGSLHSILGAMDNRLTGDGMKISCTHFQCAAWAFSELRDRYPARYCADTNYDLLSFYASLMLAQAQECILEKSMTDNRKSNIVAKIAAQIVEYFKQTNKYLETKEGASILGSKQTKEWKRRVQLKRSYHEAIMYLYLGNESQEKEKWGESVTYLETAVEKLNEAIKISSAESDEKFKAALTFTSDVINGRYNSVKKDNSFVYHDKVPSLDSLPEIKGASLVKGIPFSTADPEVSGPDIFRRLVPMEAHEASSLYSEEKAQLLRAISGRIEQKNKELEQFMSNLQLDQSKLNPTPEAKLPKELIEKCAQLSVKTTAIADLKASMNKLSNKASDMEFSINQVFTLLDDENKSEMEFQAKFGKRGLNVVLDEIRADATKLKQGLESASKSNLELHKIMDRNITNLTLLTGPLDELQQTLPSICQVQNSPEDAQVVEEMRRLVGKVDEMARMRTDKVKELREQVHNDDVTAALVTQGGGSQEEFFKEQLKKHDDIINILNMNMGAQDKICQALTETNAKYANIKRSYEETEARRNAMIAELVRSSEVLDELLSKTAQGVQFYSKLEGSINRVLERTLAVCKTQTEEREQIKQRLKPKGPPPARPKAAKPGAPGTADMSQVPGLPSLNLNEYDVDPKVVAPLPTMDKVAGPTLMDYLPFMKPGSFGGKKGAGADAPNLDKYATATPKLNQIPDVDMNTNSLPPSFSHTPVHLPPHASSQPPSPAHMTRAPTGSSRSTPSPLAQGQGGVPQGSALGPSAAASAYQAQMHGHQANISAYSRNDGSYARPYPSGSNQAPFDPSSLQSPTAPPGAPSVRGISSDVSNQVPGGPGSRPAGHVSTGQGHAPQVPAHAPAGQAPYTQPNPAHIPTSQSTQYPQAPRSQDGGIANTYTSSNNSSLPQSNTSQAQQFYPGANNTSFGSTQSSQASQRLNPQGQVNMSNAGVSQQYASATSQQPATAQQYQFPNPVQQHPATAPNYPNSTQNNPNSTPKHAPAAQSNMSSTQQFSSAVQQYPGPNQQYQGSTHPHPGPTQYPNSTQYYTSSNQYPNSAPHNLTSTQQYPSSSHPYSTTTQPDPRTQQPYPNSSQYSSSTEQYPGQAHSSVPQPGSAQPYQNPAQRNQGMLPNNQYQQTNQYPVASQQVNAAQFGASSQSSHIQGTVSGVQHTNMTQPMNQSGGPSYSSGQFTSMGGACGQQYPQTTQVSASTATQPPAQNVSSTASHFTGGHQGYPTGNQSYPAMNQSGSTVQQYPSGQNYPANQGQPSHTPSNASGYSPASSQPYGSGQFNTGLQQSSQVNAAQANQAANYPQAYGSTSNTQGASSVYPQQSSGTSQPSTGSSNTSMPNQAQSGYQGQQYSSMGYPSSYANQQPGIQSAATGQGAVSNVQKETGTQPFVQAQSGSYGQQQGAYQTNVQPTTNMQQPSQQPGANMGQVQAYTSTGQVSSNQQVGSNSFSSQQSNSQNQPAGIQQSATNQNYNYSPQQQVSQQNTGYASSSTSGNYYNNQAPNAPQNLQLSQQGGQNTVGQGYTTQYNQGPQSFPMSQNAIGSPQTMSPLHTPRPTPSATPNIIPASPLPSDNSGGQGSYSFPPNQSYVAPQAPGLPQAPAAHLPPPLTPSQPASLPEPIPPAGTLKSAVSLDDILSSSPNATLSGASKGDVLTPQRISEEEIERKREEERKTSITHDHADPYADPMKLDKLVRAAEDFSKHVESLGKQAIGGPSQLDKEWRELSEAQERECRSLSMAIARCYPMKNRYPDVMPYDATRILLTTGDDDYINASHVGDLTPSCPKFIATQSPLASTCTDFWCMVYEQGTELIVMLNAIEHERMHPYWPRDKAQPMYHGPFQLTLTSVKHKANWTESIITLTHKKTRHARSVVHLQFNGWPPGGKPENVPGLIQFIGEVHEFYTHQRSLMKPVVIHCSDGLGRTGAFCVIYSAIQEVMHGEGIVGVKDKVTKLRMRRKWMVREKAHLLFCYEGVMHYVHEFLMKRGIIIPKASFAGVKQQTPKTPKTSQKDTLFGANLPLSAIQNTVARLTLKERAEPDGGEQTTPHPHKQTSDVIMSPAPSVTAQNITPGGPHTSISAATTMQSTQSVVDNVSINQSVIHDRSQAGPASDSNVSTQNQTSLGDIQSMTSQMPQVPVASPHVPATGSQDAHLSMSDLQNPKTFSLGISTPPTKKKITKDDFAQKTQGQGLAPHQSNDDPFSSLDPMWSIKK